MANNRKRLRSGGPARQPLPHKIARAVEFAKRLQWKRAANAFARWRRAATRSTAERRLTQTKRRSHNGSSQMSKRTYHTVGRMGPRFRRPKKTGPSVYAKKGYIRYVEHGDVVNHADCVYIGHALATQQLTNAVCSAIVRMLFQKMGHNINAMTQQVQRKPSGTAPVVTPGILAWYYRVGPGADPVEVQLVLNVNQTYANAALQLENSIYATVSGNPTEDFQIYQVQFYEEGEISSLPSAVLLVESMMVHLSCSSSLAVQNRTLGNTGSVDGGESSTDVSNNPIGGKLYSGWGNGTGPRYAGNASGAMDSMVAKYNTGVITFNPTSSGVGIAAQAILRRPPASQSLLGVKKTTGVMLQPGKIRNSKIFYKSTMQMSKFWQKMNTVIGRSSTQDTKVNMGTFELLAMEKKCNTRAAGEATISVGYELNQVYRCYLTMTQPAIGVDIQIIDP